MKTGPSQDDQTLCGVFLIHGSGLQWKQSQTYGIQLGYKAGRLRRQVGEGCYKKKHRSARDVVGSPTSYIKFKNYIF